MSKKSENSKFICEACGEFVPPLNNGSYRNHCPYCLTSKHLDHIPGDRSSTCKGIMQAIGQRVHTKKGLQLVHLCKKCGHISINKIAEDSLGDDLNLLLNLPVM